MLAANRTLWAPLLIWVLVQTWKFVSALIFRRTLDYRLLWSPGGMPSAHSALVSGLAVSVGVSQGFDSAIFAVAAVLASIVMYDAAVARRATGRHAHMINRIVDELLAGAPWTEERLRELVGHTPFQVLVGGLIGAIGAWLLNL